MLGFTTHTDSVIDENGNFIGKLDSNICAMMMIIMIIVIKSLIHKFFYTPGRFIV